MIIHDMPYFLEDEDSVNREFRKIPDGSTIVISGFNISTAPEYLMVELYRSFRDHGHPKGLFLESDSLPGSPGRGIDLISEQIAKNSDDGFIEGVLVPFLGWSKNLQKLVATNAISAYTCSIGSVSHLLREMSAGRPGLLTTVGLDTFMDPRNDGPALNDRAREEQKITSEIVRIRGRDFIFLTAPKPTVGFIRGTTADEMGNISMEKEGIYGSVFTMAQATKAAPERGKVFCQVERVARFGSINPKAVHVPGPLIDYVTVAPEKYTWQTGSIEFDPRISGGIIPPRARNRTSRITLDARSVVQRRAAIEIASRIRKLKRPIIANFGVGIPAEVPAVLDMEGVSDLVYSTVEAGPWGGIPLSGEDFGVSVGPFAIIPLPDQFNLYEGGMFDLAVLGFMQVGKNGDVNPSMLPGKITGPGGFPSISTGSPFLIFAGMFTAGHADISVKNGLLTIAKDGTESKFVNNVYKVLFRGDSAMTHGKEVIFITERAVFRLENGGLVLTEIAPGVDLQKDVLEKMEFDPGISDPIGRMSPEIFQPRRMRLSSTVSRVHNGLFS